MFEADVRMDPGYDDFFPVPRAARLPIELNPPGGFDPPDLATWPKTAGRLEFVAGRLLYMPPCGEEQQLLAAQVPHLLRRWAEMHPGYDVAGNEAGMILGADVRAADAAVWPRPPRRTPRSHGSRTTAPILAVEVAGRDDAEGERGLLEKAAWYLRHGVRSVWLVLPATREVVVVRAAGTERVGEGQRIGEPELPDLRVDVSELFSVL